MSVAYNTLAEYHSLMLEAKIEFDEWERDSKKNRKATKLKHSALRKAKLEARKAFTDALDFEAE